MRTKGGIAPIIVALVCLTGCEPGGRSAPVAGAESVGGTDATEVEAPGFTTDTQVVRLPEEGR